MTTPECRKRGKITLLRLERSAEEWLDLEFAEAIARITVPKGRRRPQRFYRIAEHERHPLRIPARLIDDAIRARIPGDAIAGAIYRVLKRYVARKSRQPLPVTGEFQPPRAA